MERSHARNQLAGAPFSACAVSLTLTIALGSAGCSFRPARPQVATPAAHRTGEGRPLSVLPPYESVHHDDAIVRIVGAGNVTCTGTLIADDRVLTAHHCVAARDRKGHVLDRDMAPEDLQIEIGRDVFPWAEVKVRAIVAPQCGFVSGDGDIAILVLERHLIGMPTVNARIEAPPAVADGFEVYGFGRCALSHGPITLRSRTSDDKQDDDKTADAKKNNDKDWDKIASVAPRQFTAQAAICPGDSGGPAFNKSRDLVGVVSASVMDGDETTKGLTVFTRVDVWPQLFFAAQEISNGASPSELPPYGECRTPAKRPRTPADPSRGP